MATDRLTEPTWANSPGVWFSMLCNALAEHDFNRAAEAQQNLKRLGVSVRFRNLQSVIGATDKPDRRSSRD